MTLMELQNRRIELAGKIRALADRHGEWRESDQREWDAANAEYDQVKNEMDSIMNEPRNPRIGRDGGTIAAGPVNAAYFGGDAKVSDTDLALCGWIANVHGQPVPPEMFDAANRVGMAAGGAGFEVRLAPTRPGAFALSTTASSGYTVPSSFVARLEKSMTDVSGMLRASEVMTTQDGREMLWPQLDDADEEGVQVGEGQLSEDTDMSFQATVFRSYKFTSKMLKASHELIRDSGVALADELGSALGMRLGRVLNRKWTIGDGANTIKGILPSAVVGKTAANATAITFDELVELMHSVDVVHRGNAKWMMSDGVASVIRRLKDGEGNYLWQPNNIAGMPPLLLGAEVITNNSMPQEVASGERTILFGNLQAYKIRLVGSVRFRQLNERYAENDEIGFVSFLEADGNLLRPGSNALCPVKCLVQP